MTHRLVYYDGKRPQAHVSNLVVNTNNENVGIGVTDPITQLHVGNSSGSGTLRLSTFAPNGSNLTSNLSVLSISGARTHSNGAISNVLSGDVLGRFSMLGGRENGGYGVGLVIETTATGDWGFVESRHCETTFKQRVIDVSSTTFADIMKFDQNSNVGIGTISPSSTLDVDGTVSMSNIIVDGGFGDHTFSGGTLTLELDNQSYKTFRLNTNQNVSNLVVDNDILGAQAIVFINTLAGMTINDVSNVTSNIFTGYSAPVILASADKAVMTICSDGTNKFVNCVRYTT